MLVRRGVAHHIGMVLGKEVVYPPLLPHGADEHLEIELRVLADQLLLDIVSVILVNVKNDELAGLERRDLAAELAADGTAAARDENGLSEHPAGDDSIVGMYLGSPEKILNADILDLVDQHILVGELRQRGHDLQLCAGAGADLQYLISHLCAGRGDAENDLLHGIFRNGVGDALPAADDPHAAHEAAMLAYIVINGADHFVVGVFAGIEFLDRHGRAAACADDHRALLGVLAEAAAADLFREPLDDISRRAHKDEQENRKKEEKAPREALAENEYHQHVKGGANDGRQADISHLLAASKAPHAAVNAEAEKRNNTGDRAGDPYRPDDAPVPLPH